MSRECWAKCLGDCEGGITREHYISKSFFGTDTITVRSARFGPEPRVIGLSNLTKRMLCRRHNNLLGEHLDEVGAATFRTLSKAADLHEKRQGLKLRHFNPVKFEVDGAMLERWLLKTAINLSFGLPDGIGEGARVPGWPTDHLVKAAFGIEPLYGAEGLHFIAEVGDRINPERRLQMRAIHDSHDGGNVVAATFNFCSYRLQLNLRQQPTAHPQGIKRIHHGLKHVWMVSNDKGKPVPSHVVTWKW